MALKQLFASVVQLKNADGDELSQMLDLLNTSNFDYNDVEFIDDLVLQIARLIPLGNPSVLEKFSNYVYSLLDKQKILLKEVSLRQLAEFLIVLIKSCAEKIKSPPLNALSSILKYINTNNVGKFQHDLVGEEGTLIAYLSCVNCDRNIQNSAFHCLLHFLIDPNESSLHPDIINSCLEKCLVVLKDRSLNTTDVMALKVLICSLKCIQQIFSSKHTTVQKLGELLGALKYLLFYGLPGQIYSPEVDLHPTLRCPDALHSFESISESDTPYPKVRSQKKNKRKSKKAHQKKHPMQSSEGLEESQNEFASHKINIGQLSLSSPKKTFPGTLSRSSSSDSEFSGSDVESHNNRIKSLHTSIRQNAFLAIQMIVKTSDKKVIFGYWSSFLPEHPNMPGITTQNIFTAILKDPSPQVRLSALSLLAEMLSGSKQFLSHADGRNARNMMSFISLSSILASMIGEIHRCLLLALLSEQSFLLITQILKCYAVLCENVPYSKLHKDLLLKLLKHIKSYLYHSDVQVKVSCLMVFDSIVNSDQVPSEIEDLLLSPDFDFEIDILSSNSAHRNTLKHTKCDIDQLPWIVELCKSNIHSDDALSLRIQSLHLLSLTLGKHFSKSKTFLPVVNDLIGFCLSNSDATLQLHGAKLLDVLGRCMSNSINAEVVKEIQPLVSSLWQTTLTGSIIPCISDEDNKILQATCCDCLSSLPAAEFEKLSTKLQILYITIILGLASDSNPNVRGAATRCLGLFVLFPCLTQDLSFLDDLSVILIKSVTDPNVNVRFKASWALGNLSDALFLNKNESSSPSHVSAQFFYSTGMACIEFSKDCDRIKANAMRALGNFLYYVPEEFLNLPTIQEFVKNAASVLQLALSVKFMKVCWNACYALGNIFKNETLIKSSILSLEELLNSLLIVLKSPNFKVRISAVQSICSLPSRNEYGKLYFVIWNELINALFSATVDVNFKEIKHQQNLCDQICFGLCQLMSIILLEDIPIITEATREAKETLLASMWKFGSHITKEKSFIIQVAVDKLNALKNENDDGEINLMLLTLLNIVNESVFANHEQEKS